MYELKTRRTSIVLLEVGLLCGLALVLTALAVTPAAGQTAISSCQEINQSGDYELDSDINASGSSLDSGDCIWINASDVSLDGGDHDINGSDDTFGGVGAYPGGPSEDNLTDITVENLGVHNFTPSEGGNAIAFNEIEGGSISDVEFTENNNGVRLSSTSGVTVSDFDVTDNGQTGLYESNNDGETSNTFENGVSSDNGAYDFESTGSDTHPVVSKLDLGSSKVSFEATEVQLRGTSEPGSNPDAESIDKYFEIGSPEQFDPDGFGLDLHYTQDDIDGLDESSLKTWNYDEDWHELENESYVDTGEKVVSTNFSLGSETSPEGSHLLSGSLETFGVFGDEAQQEGRERLEPTDTMFDTSGDNLSDPELEITDVDHDVEETEDGLDVTVDATVENTGGQDGDFDVSLSAGDEEIGSESVSLPPYVSEDLSFSHEFTEPGSYDVELNGRHVGSFELESPEEPEPRQTDGGDEADGDNGDDGEDGESDSGDDDSAEDGDSEDESGDDGDGEDEGLPGFTAVVGLIALLAFAGFARRGR